MKAFDAFLADTMAGVRKRSCAIVPERSDALNVFHYGSLQNLLRFFLSIFSEQDI